MITRMVLRSILATFSNKKSADGSSEPESLEVWKFLLFSLGSGSFSKK